MRIVPSRLAANQLIDRALSATGPATGLESRTAFPTGVLTLRQLTSAVSATIDPAGRAITSTTRSFLIDDLIERLEPAVRDLLGPGISSSGATQSIDHALSEIRHAGLKALDIASAADGSRRLRAFAAVVDAYERALADRGFIDDADLIADAAVRVREGTWPTDRIEHLVVEGLYDVTRVQGSLLRALARASGRTTVRIPFDPHHETLSAYAFPYLKMWESVDDPGLAIDIELAATEKAAGQAAILESRDPLDEARRIAGWIRSRAERGTPIEEIAIILAGGTGTLGSIERELTRSAIACHTHRARRFVETPAFGLLFMPFRMLQTGLRRDLISAWVSSPLTTRLDAESLRAPIIAGPPAADSSARWKRALSGVRGKSAAILNATLDRISTLASREHDPATFWSAYEQLLESAGVFDSNGLDDAAIDSWDEAIDGVRSALADLGRWRAPPLRWPTHRRHLLDALDRTLISSGRLGRGVAILSPRDARGLTFRRVAVAGLVEGAYGQRGRPAATLGDRQREQLNDHLGRRLLRSAADEAREATLLLLAALRSAREEVILSRASEDDEGNPQLPAHALDAVRLALDLPVRAPDMIERRSWRIDRSSSSVTRAQEAERTRTQFFGRPPESRRGSGDRYSGDLRGALDLLALEATEGRLCAWSAGRLDRWRQCPHQFFMQYVLGMKAPDEGALETEPRVLGTVVHDALRNLYRSWAGDDTISRSDIAAALARAAEDLSPEERGDPHVWPLLFERVVAEVALYLRAAPGPAKTRRRPAAFEIAFGLPDDGDLPPIRLTTPAGLATVLRGRIDRIDVGDEGDVLHVVDYKFSKASRANKAAADPRECGVNQFQMWVYFLAALAWAETQGRPEPQTMTAAIHAVREPRIYKDVVAPHAEEIRATIGSTIDDAMEGRFDASPNEADVCRYCDYRLGCRIATGFPEAGADDTS